MNHVYYHGGKCLDGFTSAWVAHWALGEQAQFHPMMHHDKVPAHEGDTVYFIDIVPADVTTVVTLAATAKDVVIIDHHPEAQEIVHALSAYNLPNVHVTFNKELSGAGLALQYFDLEASVKHRIQPLVEFVQDEDLWLFKMAETKAICRFARSMTQTFDDWSDLEWKVRGESSLRELVAQGNLLLEEDAKQIDKVLQDAKPVVICGEPGLMCNCPEWLVNDVGAALASKSGTYGLCWQANSNGIRMSFRALKPYNVRPLAKHFDGGGHEQACGAKVSFEQFFELLQQD